jgi:general secretion pathway protein N
MMKPWWHFLLVGIFAWLLFMVWRLPATVAYDMAAESLGEQVQLAGITGTVWEGEAQQLQYQNKLVAGTRWKLSPWGLLLGRLNGLIKLTHDEGYLQAQASVPFGGGEIALSEIKGKLPLALIQQHLTMIPLPLQGEMSLKLDTLMVSGEGQVQQADGRIVWHQAGVQVMDKLQFGDLQMSLHSVEGEGIEGTISDSGGPLQINANFTLSAEGIYTLEGQAKPGESAPKELRNSLAMLGKVDSQGNYPLKYSGKL